MNTFSLANIALFLAVAASLVSPTLTRAGGWNDILKPDYKREFSGGKNFKGKSFSADKEFTIKSFPAEKTVKPKPFPEQPFRNAKAAPAETKRFVPKQSAFPEKSFRAGNWENSNRHFEAKDIPPKESALDDKQFPLAEKAIPTPEPTELNKQAPQAEKSAPPPRIMDEETARQLIEKLYGPMGGRGQ